MRKIPSHLECPVDDYILHACEVLNPFFKSLNLTPNHLTTFSLIFGLLTMRFFILGMGKYAAICWVISYFFDCADGNYAREYNMVSEGGDKYDHYKDWFVNWSMYVIALYRKNYGFVVLAAVFAPFLWAYFECQEMLYDKPGESSTLPSSSNIMLCNKDNMHRILSVVRHMGCGSLTIAQSVYLWYI